MVVFFIHFQPIFTTKLLLFFINLLVNQIYSIPTLIIYHFTLIVIHSQNLYHKFYNYNEDKHKPQMNADRRSPIKSSRLLRSRNKRKQKYQQQSQEDAQYSQAIYEKFLKILNKKRQNFLKQHLTQYYGKNFPINYKDHYLFEQQWENKINYQQKKGYNFINESNPIQIVLSVATILIYFVTIWITNIDFVFKNQGKIIFYYETYSFTMLITLVNVILRVAQYCKETQQNFKFIETIKSEYLSIGILVYLIAKLVGVNRQTNPVWTLYETSMLIVLYMEVHNRYQRFRLMNFSLQYQYQTKVFDMIVTIFVVAHIITIVLYLMTKVHPQDNWLTPLNVDQSQQFIVYILAYYFCTTTIMTVGYGDIVPKNPLEVLVVTLVQIFGIVMLGYMINQIGYCISALRKGRQDIEKDLLIIQKLKKHYKMTPNLTFKVRSYLVNSKPNINQLSPDEEKGVLLKLNEQIRIDLMRQNMISIIKSSVFFLCRWTNYFQQSVSSRLVHLIFNPNDILYQPIDKERIYIIKSGKVNIHVNQTSGNKKLNNALKVISNNLNKDVSDNCYGYTAVISRRPVKLHALAKQFTSAYYIQKDKFMECVNDKIPDIEFYHEIKTKIDGARRCQSYQICRIQSSKHHYNPTKNYLIRKTNMQNHKMSRKFVSRRKSSVFRGIKPIFSEEMMKQARDTFHGDYSSSYDIICEETEFEKQQSQQKNMNKINQSQEFYNFVVRNQISGNFHHYFQSGKEYTNFYPKNNKLQILKRYETEYFMQNYEQLKANYRLQINSIDY